MEEQIDSFVEQFSWEPEVVSPHEPGAKGPILLFGMGGSHLGARLLLRHDPSLPLTIHSDYGLPKISDEALFAARIVISSYSGETEETIDALRACLEKGLRPGVITSGGTLAKLARENNLPLVLLPTKNIEPRMAIGYAMIAFARITQEESLEQSIRNAGKAIRTIELKKIGTAIAEGLSNKIPVLYASNQNLPIAYHIKAAFNETAKIPAFFNAVPEVCHNEISGYDVSEKSAELISNMCPVFLQDKTDTDRIALRMQLLQDIFAERHIPVLQFPVLGETPLHAALMTVLAGSFAGLTLAKTYGVPDSHTPLISDFKERLKRIP